MNNKLSKEEIQYIRDISIHSLLSIQNRDTPVKICCPIHNEKTPSFVLYPNNSFKCYGCGIHGNGAIDLCILMGYSFKQSLLELSKYL
jgi:DNA primase